MIKRRRRSRKWFVVCYSWMLLGKDMVEEKMCVCESVVYVVRG